MAADDAGPEHPAAADPGRDTSHDDDRPTATPPDADGPDGDGSDGDGSDGERPGDAAEGAPPPNATPGGATADAATSDGTTAEEGPPDTTDRHADPDAAPDNGDVPQSPDEPAMPDRNLFRDAAAPMPPAPPGHDDPDGLPRFLASLDFGPAAGQPAPAVTHDRNRRALVLVSSVAAVAVAGLVGAFAALNTSPHAGPQNGPRPVASNGAMLATSQGPNRFTPPYFGQPTTGAGNGNGDARPRTHSSAPPSASSSSASERPSHQPSQAPSSTHASSSPTFPRVSCPPLPTLLRGAAPDILCPLEGSQD